MAGAVTVKMLSGVKRGRAGYDLSRWRRAVRLATSLAVLAAALTFFTPGHMASFFKPSSTFLGTRGTNARVVEARLTGAFPWAPFRARAEAGVSKSDLRLASALGSVLAGVRGQSTPKALHTTGIAQLLADRPRQALGSLTAAAESANDAHIRSDLAVALFETASRYNAPELLADALAACDRAMAADAQLVEPFFNRALVLERLGLRDDAREAWEQYLMRDGSSAWAAEAREHLRGLVRDKPFLELVDDAATRRAFTEIPESVRKNPQEARARSEMQLLGRWGKAVLSGDDAAAERNLRIARSVGRELAALNGDEMVALAVAAIDGAGTKTQATLASAHADYDDGLAMFQANRPGEAEPRLRRAAASFHSAGSPMARRARFFAANTAFEQGKEEEVQRELQKLLATTPAGLHAARAELLWQLGSCSATRAEWGEAIRSLEGSAAIFDQLGEVRNAASVRRMLAVVFDQIGDPGRAWSYRMAALRGVGGQSDLALVKAVSSIAGAATLRRKWHSALSFLTLEIEIAQRIADDVQLAHALLSRAAVNSRLGDVTPARDDLANAERATARVKDAAYVAYGRATESIVRAMLAGSPGETVSLLTDAIAFQSTKGDRMNLPGLFLQRGRAHRANGDAIAAAADLESGMVEQERHRQSLPSGDARWGAFFAAEELFEEAIDLAVDRNDVPRAFAVAERGRARVLLESYGRSPFADRLLPEGTVVVEYAALPKRLIMFVASASGVMVVTTNCDRDTLAAEVDAFASALTSDDAAAARRTGSALYRRLIEPVAALLTHTVAFVPDSVTAIVPFNALIDEQGHYLIERHTVVVTPSAAAFAAAAEKRSAATVPKSVTIIANAGTGGNEARLGFVNAEAREVARLYRSATRLEENEATIEAVERALSSADVVHFSGHAVGDDSGLLPASLVLQREGRERHVTVTEIARLRVRGAPTVVLAGCNTARGERRGPEGVMSVANGFLIAGAPSVIATLWPIDDRVAADFFPRLHKRLRDGLPPAEALRAVQIDAIRNRDIPPSFWAALIDIGT